MAQATLVRVHDDEQETDLHGNETDTTDRIDEAVHKVDESVASAPAPHKTTRCYLLEIPPELRLRIYEDVFDTDFTPEVFIWPSGEIRMYRSERPPNNFSLIAREAAPVLYEGRTFYVHVLPDPCASEYPNSLYKYLRPVDRCLWFEQVQTIKLYVYAGPAVAAGAMIIKSMFMRRHQKQSIAYLHLNLLGLGEGDGDPLYKVLNRLSICSGAHIHHLLSSSTHVVSKEVLEEFQQTSGAAKHVFSYS
ncbi:hypothetical protein LTR17_001988 [Elasticomyces elasticus]|nr:hypothetical protein LTR17_001988 [Elasticomyces elasticus]